MTEWPLIAFVTSTGLVAVFISVGRRTSIAATFSATGSAWTPFATFRTATASFTFAATATFHSSAGGFHEFFFRDGFVAVFVLAFKHPLKTLFTFLWSFVGRQFAIRVFV